MEHMENPAGPGTYPRSAADNPRFTYHVRQIASNNKQPRKFGNVIQLRILSDRQENLYYKENSTSQAVAVQTHVRTRHQDTPETYSS